MGLTIVALAQERRSAPQRPHTAAHRPPQRVLRADEGTWGTPDVEVRLREQIAKLKKTVANKDKELTRLRSDVPALVRLINQITAENAELRETLKVPPANVVPLSRRTGSSAESGTPRRTPR